MTSNQWMKWLTLGLCVSFLALSGMQCPNVINDDPQDGGDTGQPIPDTENSSPVAAATADPATAGVGQQVALDATASSDPDGDALTFAWAQTGGAPQVILVGATLDTAGFVAPNVRADTVLTFTVTVGDGTETATASVDVTILGENDPPVADAGEDISASPSANVALDGTRSSDPDNDPLIFAWRQIDGPSVPLNQAESAKPSFQVPAKTAPGTTYIFELTVDDGILTATDQVTVLVQGGIGGAPALEVKPNILDFVPGDALFAVGSPNLGGGVADLEELFGPAGLDLWNPDDENFLLNLLKSWQKAVVIFGRPFEDMTEPELVVADGFLLEESPLGGGLNLSAIADMTVEELVGVVNGVINEITGGGGNFQARAALQENGTYAITIVEQIPDGMEAEVFTFFAANVKGNHYLVISGMPCQVLAIVDYAAPMLKAIFEASWVNAFNANDLMIYLSRYIFGGFLPPLMDMAFLGDSSPIASAASLIALQQDMGGNMPGAQDILYDQPEPGVNAIFLTIGIPNPVLVNIWARFDLESMPAAWLVQVPTTSQSTLLGLPNEPVFAAVGSEITSLDQVDVPQENLMATRGGYGSDGIGVLGVNDGVPSLPNGQVLGDPRTGIIGLDEVELPGIVFPSTYWMDDAAAFIQAIVDLYEIISHVGEKQNLSVSQIDTGLGSASVITTDDPAAVIAEIHNRVAERGWMEAFANTGEQVNGMPVTWIAISRDNVIDRLTKGSDLDVEDVDCLFGFEQIPFGVQIEDSQGKHLVFRLVQAGNGHVAISMGGGLNRLTAIANNVLAGIAPLTDRALVAAASGFLDRPLTLEAYLAPTQLARMIETVDACQGGDPVTSGNATAAIGVAIGPEGPSENGMSAHLGIVIPLLDMLKDVDWPRKD